MTNFLHWRKMTWTLVLWSAYIVVWAVITASGPAMIGFWWLAGMIVLAVFWLAHSRLSNRVAA